MRVPLFLAVTAALPLAACGDGADARKAGPAKPDPIEVQMNQFDDVHRNIALVRAVIDADFTCKRVVKSVSKPRDNGHPVWLATCEDGGEYVVTLLPGGIFSVSGVKQSNRLRFPKATSTPEAVKELLK